MDRSMNMTTGKAFPILVKLAVPLIITNLGQQFYGIVDAAIVGRGVGVNAFASMGSTDWPYWFILWSVVAITTAFSIPVSQCFGAKDYKGMKNAVAMSVFLSLVLGIILTVVCVLLASPLLHVLHTKDELFAGARLYLTVMYAGTLITIAYNMSSALLRAVGDGRTPLIAMIIAGTMNVLLDGLFVLVFHFGILGAALATLLAQMIAFLYNLRIVLKSPLFKLEREDWNISKPLCIELLQLGLPMAISQIIVATGGVLGQGVINGCSTYAVAGFTAGNKLHGLMDCSAGAIGTATAAYVGQNWGAGLKERTKKGFQAAAILTLIVGCGIAFVMIFFGRPIVSLFVSSSAEHVDEVLDVGQAYVRVMGCLLPTAYFMHIFRSPLQALGNKSAPPASGIAELCGRLTGTYIMPLFLGQVGLYFMDGLAWAFGCIFLVSSYFWYMYHGKRW